MPVVHRLRLASILHRISLGCAVLVLVVGALGLLAWIVDHVTLQSIIPGLPTMKVNTALCFMLCGLSLLALW